MSASRDFLERHDELELSSDPARLDRALIHRYLANESYWATGVPKSVIERALDHSLCFGVYRGRTQLAFARAVTDRATFAYLADVFVVSGERGRGLGKWLVEAIGRHPELRGLRRWLLATRDAHALYAQYGFKPLANPARFMERHDPEVYAPKRPAR
jgi:GNAT superfamily N-acetyltransferase